MATNFVTQNIDPERLQGYVRERTVLTGPTLETVLPKRAVPDIEFELQNLDSPFVNIARYRAWDTPPPVGKRAGFAVVRGEIPPLGFTMMKNEKEVLRLAKIEAATPGAGVQDIYNDGVQAGLAVEARIEIARADVLTDGVLTLNENGVGPMSADFGVPGTHLVTAGTAWTNVAASVPVDDLLAWEAVYRADNGGRNPDGWLVSSAVMGNLMRNTQVKSIANQGGGVPGIVAQDQVGQVLRVAGVQAPLVVFDGTVPDTAGAPTATLNNRHVIGVRAGLGEVLMGPTSQAQLATIGGQVRPSIAPGLFTVVEELSNPTRIHTTTHATALPVLRDPKALFRAVV